MVVNPAILSFARIPTGPSAVVTILTAFVGTLLMDLYANRPIGVAPYMGENAFIWRRGSRTASAPSDVSAGVVERDPFPDLRDAEDGAADGCHQDAGRAALGDVVDGAGPAHGLGSFGVLEHGQADYANLRHLGMDDAGAHESLHRPPGAHRPASSCGQDHN